MVIVLVLVGVVARVALRRPWTVEAEARTGPRTGTLVAWRVVGWRASREQSARVAYGVVDQVLTECKPHPIAGFHLPRPERNGSRSKDRVPA